MKKCLIVLFATITMLQVNAQNEQQLREVTVMASRTVNNADGYSVNLRGADLAKGKPVAEVLPFLPNVSSENGRFKINGLVVSEIYLDGVKLSDVSELGNIPGETVDKVQVKYFVGADCNSSLNGGAIYITLRRPPEGGYYGSVSADADWSRSSGIENGGVGGMMSYRYNGLSVYDNLNLNGMSYKETAEQWFTGPDLHSFLTESSETRGYKFRNRLSLNQQFVSGIQFGGSYYIATSITKPHTTSEENNVTSVIGKKKEYLIQEGTLKFVIPFGSKGANMTLTADYFNRNSDDATDYTVEVEEICSIKEHNNLDLWKLKADIIYTGSRTLIWKFGASAQWIASSYKPLALIESDRFVCNITSTKTTGFTPIVHAAAQGVLWKLRYSAGVNWQMNRISYLDRSTDVRDYNAQWSINPTVQIMMPIGARNNHSLMLNYKRTMSDIPYSAISSQIKWENANNYTVGNPNLKAQSADMIMAGLSLLRNRINIMALYACVHDMIYWQTFQSTDKDDVFYTKPINISGQKSWGFGAEWITSPKRWWKFKLSGRVEIAPENETVGNTHYGSTRFKEYFSFNNNFNFGNDWGGMLNMNLEPTFSRLDRTYHSVYNVNGRIYKTFLDNNLQVAVDFTPVGNRRKLDRQAGANKISIRYTTPVQHVGISVTWNFSGGKQQSVNVVDGIQAYRETEDSK